MPSWWEHCTVLCHLVVGMKGGGLSARYEKLSPSGPFCFALRQRGHLYAPPSLRPLCWHATKAGMAGLLG